MTIRIVSVAYKEGLPEILGVSDNLTEDFNQEVNILSSTSLSLLLKKVEGSQLYFDIFPGN